MIISNDELKQIYEEYVRGRAASGRADCPDPETLVKIAMPGAQVGNRKELLDHIGTCSPCTKELKLILNFHRETDALSAQLIKSQKRRPFDQIQSSSSTLTPQVVKFAAAFFGIAMTFLSLYLVVSRNNTPAKFRSAMPLITLLSPNGDVRISTPLLFQWQAVPEAAYYVLEIFDEELLGVWMSPPLEHHRFLLPGGVTRTLSANKPYYWMITAFSKKEKIAESDLFQFVFRPQ